MAYGYAKMLNRLRQPARVACHDMKHLMSQPEWDDLDLNPEDFPNEGNFFENTADLNGYKRPEWFVQDHIGIRDYIASAIDRPSSGFDGTASTLLRGIQLSLSVSKFIPARVRNFGRGKVHEWLDKRRSLNDGGLTAEDWESAQRIIAERIRAISVRSRESPATWAVSLDEAKAFAPQARWLLHKLHDAEVVFAYAAAPIYPMLTGRVPHVAVEIGTIRDLPFEGTAWGNMIGLAYRHADHVLITNPDNIVAAQRLGLTRYSFCPHPVDENVFTCSTSGDLRQDLLNQYGVKHLLIAPARQNWELKGNDIMLAGFACALKGGLDAQLLIPAWGQEIDRSKALAAQLGIERHVAWLKPMSERGLIKYYQSVDIVLDQFKLGVFGLTTPKAMACGRPVVCAYDPAPNRWCFPVDPPLMRAASIEEVSTQLLRLVHQPAEVKHLGEESRRWILAYHATDVTVKALVSAGREAMEWFAGRSRNG